MFNIFEIAENKKNFDFEALSDAQKRAWYWGNVAAICDTYAYNLGLAEIDKFKFICDPLNTFLNFYFGKINLYLCNDKKLHELIGEDLQIELKNLEKSNFLTSHILASTWSIAYNRNRIHAKVKKMKKEDKERDKYTTI